MSRGLPIHEHCRRVIALAFALASLLAFGPLAGSADAAYTATVLGRTATLTAGENSGQLLLRVESEGNLIVHNRFSQGDPCFESEADWHCTPGVQTLENLPVAEINVVGSAGPDDVAVRAQGGVPAIQAKLNLDVKGGGDSTLVVEVGDGTQAVTLDGGRIEGAIPQPIDSLGFTAMLLATGSGDDTIEVASTPTAPTRVFAGEGDDALAIADGAELGAVFLGQRGSDTLDYSDWSTPVTAELGVFGQFKAQLAGASEVPPNDSPRTGSATILIDPISNSFVYELLLNEFVQADVTDSHIHAAAAGANGPVVFGIGPGGVFDDLGAERLGKAVGGLNDPGVTTAALQSGGLYFNVHTTTFGDGEIRGQIELDPEAGYLGTATGTTNVRSAERVIGGTGDDLLRGTPAPDRLLGGGGIDTIEGGGADDVVLGGGDADVLRGGEGDDLFGEGDAANGGDLIDGGPGSDRVDYGARANAVTADLASEAAGEDGEAGEGDDISSSVEHATGGAGGDSLVGNDADNLLAGGDGEDEIEGGLGADEVDGGPGPDSLDGGNGDDTLEAADGVADLAIDCGDGAADSAHRDPAAIDPDAIVSGCETVDPPLVVIVDPDPDPEGEKPPPGDGEDPPPGDGDPPPGGGLKPPEPPRPVGLLSSVRAKASGGGAQIAIDTRSRATCPTTATAACTLKVTATAAFPAGTLAVKAKRATLGKVTRSLAPGVSAPAVLKVAAGKSAAWREAGRLKISFVISLAVPGGEGAERRGSASLAPPRRK